MISLIANREKGFPFLPVFVIIINQLPKFPVRETGAARQSVGGIKMEFLATLLKSMPNAAGQGLIWGIMAIGVYLTLRVISLFSNNQQDSCSQSTEYDYGCTCQ